MAENQGTTASTPATRWYALSVEDAAAELKVDLEKGLTPSEAKARQAEYGRNELPVTEGTPLWQMILEQFQDVTVILLIIAAVISIVIGEAKDSIVIFVIVGLNALIGVYQERQAENALAVMANRT